MENHQFWAFFVIALIAGGAITLGVSNATMTGHAVQVQQPTFFSKFFQQAEPVEMESAKEITPEVVPTAITTIQSTTEKGAKILGGANEFNNKLTAFGLDDPMQYGHLGKWMIAFSNIYTACYDIFKDKEFCLAFTQAAWMSGTGHPVTAIQPGQGTQMSYPCAMDGDGAMNGGGSGNGGAGGEGCYGAGYWYFVATCSACSSSQCRNHCAAMGCSSSSTCNDIGEGTYDCTCDCY